MKGKRKQLASAAKNPQQDFNNHLNLNSTLNTSLLLRAYALSPSSDSPFYSSCLNRYTVPRSTSPIDPLRPLEPKVESKLNRTVDLDPGVASQDEAYNVVEPLGKIALKKGKGKARPASASTTDASKLVSSCSSAKCGSNPKCLNYLGQEKWESIGKFQRHQTRQLTMLRC